MNETDTDAEQPSHEESRFERVGERLATERKRQGLSLDTIAERTRIPTRHLAAIESSDVGALPGITYTLGFARSYARTLGMNASEIGADMRSELSEQGVTNFKPVSPSYEPTDPSRVPSRFLALTAAGIGIALAVGLILWGATSLDLSGDETATVKASGNAPAVKAVVPDTPVNPNGQVVMTANDTVWVRVYDATNKRLYEKEMAKGDSFTIPADANKPMINTGRAQALDFAIDGKKIPAIAPADTAVSNLEISASALSAAKEPASSANANGNNVQNKQN